MQRLMRARRIRNCPVIRCSGCAYIKAQRNKKLPFKAHTVAGGWTHIKVFSFDAKGLSYTTYIAVRH